MTPDYQTAAIKAAETLVKYSISTAPVIPLPIFKKTPGVLVLSFADMSSKIGIERNNLVTMFGLENQDAVTSVHIDDGNLRYLVAYNQQLPFYMLQRALARELGHIILKHDGSKPEEVRTAEALCFAKHFICPRALIHALQESGTPLTTEAVGSVTGCNERCMNTICNLPGVDVPAELNRQIKQQFSAYVDNFKRYQAILVEKTCRLWLTSAHTWTATLNDCFTLLSFAFAWLFSLTLTLVLTYTLTFTLGYNYAKSKKTAGQETQRQPLPCTVQGERVLFVHFL